MKAKKMPPLDLEALIPLLIGVWRRYHKLGGPGDVLQTREFRSVVSAVQELQRGLETGDQLIGQNYFQQRDLLGAYMLYQWIVHYQEGMSLINELPWEPKRVLDIGSGPAAFSFAACRHGAQEVIALDQSSEALRIGAEICGRYGFPLSIREHDCRKQNFPVEGKFDLIIVGHCLRELFPDTQKGWQQAQEAWLDYVLSLLTPEGFLLIVDSSLPHVNRRILTLREMSVEKGLAVQAPCIWKGACPALQSNTQCYAQREFDKPYLIREIQRAAQINLSSLKMSYLILRSPGFGWPELPPKLLYRVISPAIESDQGKHYYLCGTDGKKSLSSQLEEHTAENRAFDYLKRGEVISIEDPVIRQNRFEIGLGTRVRIEAALGKPLPL